MFTNIKSKITIFLLAVISLFFISNSIVTTQAFNEKYSIYKEKEFKTFINNSTITMIATKDIQGTLEDNDSNELIPAGAVVLADINSLLNEFIKIEFNNNVFYVDGDAFKAVVISDDTIQQVSEKTREEFIKIDSERWAKYETEYPTATYIWKFLKEEGYNDYVIAGIIGNMMTETGGQTLNIQYDIWGGKDNCYYGICQWYNGYGVVADKDLEAQCNFLVKSLPEEFNEFGALSGYTYEDFCSLEDAETAAKVFAKTYARCGNENIIIRETNALKALKYFTEN